MARSQERSQRKASGGRHHYVRTKRKYELSGYPANTKLASERKTRSQRTLGGNRKMSLLEASHINIADKKGKTTKAKILNVVENPANPHLVRRNIITKGAIVETEKGRVRVTSRPGQEAALNGMLV
ncbi:30S ribosomal protein S8e [Candidatus Woesearchaeota archaeon]|nr:30S ribosomal protein S8e [Candidatus Woesearchaeota archaeon]